MKRVKARTAYLLAAGGAAFGMAAGWTMFTPLMVIEVGLTPLQLVLLGTMLEAVYFLFEVPTGVVADMFSRRLSVIVGYGLLGTGFVIIWALPVFGVILAAEAVQAIGYTFISGALSAWLVDEIGEEQAGEVFVRGAQVGSGGAALGVIAAGVLAAVNLRLPMLGAGGALIGLAAALALLMPERGFTPLARTERTTFQTMGDTFREGLRVIGGRPVLIMMVGMMLFEGLYSEGYDRLWTPHLIESYGLPALTLPLIGTVDEVVWFSIISLISMLLTIAATEGLRRGLDLNDERTAARLLAVIYALLVGGMLTFALSSRFTIGLLALFWVYIMRSLIVPIYQTLVNKHIDSSVRATVLSMTTQSNAFGQIFGGPLVGWIGTVRTLRAALVVSALLAGPNVPLLGVLARKLGGGAPAVEGEEAAAPVTGK